MATDEALTSNSVCFCVLNMTDLNLKDKYRNLNLIFNVTLFCKCAIV